MDVKRPLKRGELAEIDLAEVERLALLGHDSVSEIALVMGISKQVLSSPEHGAEVKKAFERGRAAAKSRALEQYEASITGKNGNISALLIFKLKQYGWTDRATLDGTIEVTSGARERVLEAVDKLIAKRKAEKL